MNLHSDTEPLIPGTLLSDESVSMPRIMARNIRAHATEYVPQEVCGLIGGADPRHWGLLARTPNHSVDNRHNYRIEPAHYFTIERGFEFQEHGALIRAVYHSHVGTPPVPSQSDIAGTPSEMYIVIYSVAQDELRVWRGEKPINLEVF
jgi:proteasome lid subunit RPN8/RPN11